MTGSGRGRPRVLLLCGGRSGEHDVSLASAASVLAAASDRMELIPRVIARDGRLLSEAASREALRVGTSAAVHDPDADPDLVLGLASSAREVDAVFPLLHGPNGEDGTVQGLLTVLDVPYVGADVLGSATGMDKPTMKRVFAAVGLPQVPWREVAQHAWTDARHTVARDLEALPWPRFVKPATLGSSVGIGRAGDDDELAAALDRAFLHGPRAVVEAGVVGARELEVAVLGDDRPQVSLPGEIVVLRDGFYDYRNKYSDGGAELRIPARLDEGVQERIRGLAREAFAAVHASGLARVDFFLTPTGEVLLNEINTMPGFTRHSMYPKLWEAVGLPYPELIERLVDLARERHGRESARAAASA